MNSLIPKINLRSVLVQTYLEHEYRRKDFSQVQQMKTELYLQSVRVIEDRYILLDFQSNVHSHPRVSAPIYWRIIHTFADISTCEETGSIYKLAIMHKSLIYIYVYLYINTYAYIYIYIYVYIYIYIYMCVCVCVCVCVCLGSLYAIIIGKWTRRI